MRSYCRFVASLICTISLWAQQPAAPEPPVFPTAVLPFEERGPGVEGQGRVVADILFATLAQNPRLYLVDRQEMAKLLAEAELNLSGVVNASQAIQIGQLTGARILLTGSVFKAGPKTYIVAKVIGSETSKVLGRSVNGTEAIDELATGLATQVSELLVTEGSGLVPQVTPPADRLAALRQQLAGKQLPTVVVTVKEQHVGRAAIDPAAETELIRYWKELGGEVIDNLKGSPAQAEYRIEGEGFSEFATQTRGLVSVKARLEVKVLDKAGKVVAIDRQATVQVDLNELGAGKAALQEAAARIAERIIPRLAK